MKFDRVCSLVQKLYEPEILKKADVDNWPWWQENIGSTPSPCEEDPGDKARCRKVAQFCREKCSDEALPGPRTGQGMQFFRCYNTCMEAHGCL